MQIRARTFIGVNAGEAAGQTVPHTHLHVIPRYPGDVEDPRGGCAARDSGSRVVGAGGGRSG